MKNSTLILIGLLSMTANALEVGDAIAIPSDQIHCTDVAFSNCKFFLCGPDSPNRGIAGVEVKIDVSVSPIAQLQGIKSYETCENLRHALGTSASARLIKKTDELLGEKDRHITLEFDLKGEITLSGEGTQ